MSLVAGVLQKGGQRRGGRHHPFPLPLQITHPLRFVAGDGEVELVEISVEHGGGLVGMWGAHTVHERRRGGGERLESAVLFLEGGV